MDHAPEWSHLLAYQIWDVRDREFKELPRQFSSTVVKAESSFIDLGKMMTGKDVRAGVSGKPSWTFRFEMSIGLPSGDVECATGINLSLGKSLRQNYNLQSQYSPSCDSRA